MRLSPSRGAGLKLGVAEVACSSSAIRTKIPEGADVDSMPSTSETFVIGGSVPSLEIGSEVERAAICSGGAERELEPPVMTASTRERASRGELADVVSEPS